MPVVDWSWLGASIIIAACILPPGLALAIVVGAIRAVWVGASHEAAPTEVSKPDA